MSPKSISPVESFSSDRKLRLGHFITHPIQYFAPLYRRLAQEPDIDLTVVFSSDLSVRKQGYTDSGFGVEVKWDVPLLDGYNYEFLPVLRNSDQIGFAKPLNRGVERTIRNHHFHALWLHGYSTLTNLRAACTARSLHIPAFIHTDSSRYNRSPAKLLVKRAFFYWLRPKLSGVLAIGKNSTDYWRYNMGPDFPIFPYPYAVDNDLFQQRCCAASPHREQFRQSLGLKPGRPVILFAAKFIARKRAIDLIAAYIKNWREGVQPAPYLLLIGDGPERDVLKRMVSEANCPDIRFLGFRNQSELPAFYDLCDVFVLASVNEPWGLAINEAMNAGRAVIVSEQVGCQPDLVEDGVNGAVVQATQIDSLAAGLRRVLSSEEVWERMGESSLRKIADYSFEQDIAGIRKALEATVPGFHAQRKE